MSRQKALLCRLLRLVSFSVLLSGLVLVTLAVLELAGESSRGSHVLAGMRWPAVGVLLLAGVLALLAAFRDISGKSVIRARMLRDLLILAVMAIAAQVLFSQNFKPILFQLSFGLAAGGFAGLRLLEAHRRAWEGKVSCQRLEFSLFCVCATVVLLECGLRLTARFSDSPLLSRETETVQAALRRFQLPPGALHFSFPCNSTSHYDEEFTAGELGTVVSIGDSFSFGVVPQYYHYSSVAEREMDGVAVHNLGYAGIGPGGYLHILENEGLGLDGDLISVNLFIGNDIFEAARWNAEPGLLESICDRRNVLSYLLPQRLYRLATGDTGLGILGKSELARPSEDTPVTEPAKLLRRYPWLEDPSLELGSLTEAAFLEMECKRASLNEQAKQFGGYELLFSSLQKMRGMVGKTPFCVMLIPDQYQVDDDLWHEILTSLGRKDLHRDEPQRIIRAWLEEEGIPYLDLLPALRAEPLLADGERHLYHLRDTHFNARGNAVAGAALARFLKAQLH